MQSKRVPLTPEWWKLNTYRSVQYVQNDAQKQALAKRTPNDEAT
jgi:hypothetical protein